MQKLREVTVFSNGDSEKISTWSNVPYFFTSVLEAKGIKVNRVNLDCLTRFEKIFCKPFFFLIGLVTNNRSYNYYRSKVYFDKKRTQISNAIKKFPDSQADIFLTFSFSSVGLTQRPIIQFCDWTYSHHLKYFLNRKPGFLQKKCVERENAQIEGADLIFPLFPAMARSMKEEFPHKSIFYLGNVINSVYKASQADLSYKETSEKLLFVGSKIYIEGAKSLVAAYSKLKSQFKGLELHIIGMNESDISNLPKGVFCYGYLDKAKDHDRALYYKLFREARVFINTTPKWGAFSASLEAMYFYNPVIVAPYEEFVETFGSKIDFGYYCDENTILAVQENIQHIFSNKDYRNLCLNAHKVTARFTWDSYIGSIVEKVENVLAVRGA